MKPRDRYEFSHEVRRDILRRDRHTCQCCGEKLTSGRQQIHHKIPVYFAIKNFPDINPRTFAQRDFGITLCPSCHDKEHKEKTETEYWALAQAMLGLAGVGD